MIRAAVLTISDSSHQGTREDKSGPAIAARLTELGWIVVHTEILPDDRTRIAARFRDLADTNQANLILATGGTGVAQRDVTPEALRDVLHKEIPGLGEQMRAEGLKATPLAPLSRSLGATRAQSLIVCLPGSPKGALESLNAIVKLIPHIVDLLEGRTGH
ncbi:MAG: MogA/MoaB family molybdenum cofactor biosynthesis protein [Bryobacterales bacterium]|nr:MogA/MoaB family molybdenum cofactor biosynthesis protein [Bryobacterales bacterium]